MDYEKARRILDNKLWTRDEIKKLRGKIARARSRSISNILKQVHTPWHKRSTPNTIHDPGTILFDLT